MLKEFTAVTVLLICNSRTGFYDAAATPLILYATLIIFNFPLLNPYLFAYMRLGPWSTTKGSTPMRILQIVLVSGAQIAGAAAAAAMRNKLTTDFGYESLNNPTGGATLQLNKKCGPDDAKTTLSFVSPYFSKNALGENGNFCYGDNETSMRRTWWVFEETAGVFLFLVGVTHIIEAELKPILKNTFWSKETTHGEKKAKDPYTEVPVKLIAYICALFFGMQKAFPTSHLALTVSVYLETLENMQSNINRILIHQEELWFRLLGGLIGTGAAIAYYYAIYVKAGTETFRRVLDSTWMFQSKAPSTPAYQPIAFKQGNVSLDVKVF